MASIDSILNKITSVLNASRTPPPTIPSLLLLTGAKMRPGLSASIIASKIITRQNEAGAPEGVLPSGNKNISELMEVIRVEEIIDAILTDARIDVAVMPGIALTAGGLPGITTAIGNGTGIIR